MTTKVKKIKALLGLKGTSDPEVLKLLNAAHDGMNGNPAFSGAPFDMQTFKAEAIRQRSLLKPRNCWRRW